MILTTEKVKEKIRECLPSLGVKNPEKILAPSMAQFGGIGVHVLPDAAFVGLETDKGGEPNLVVITDDFKQQVIDYWDALAKGYITIKQLRKMPIKKDYIPALSFNAWGATDGHSQY